MTIAMVQRGMNQPKYAEMQFLIYLTGFKQGFLQRLSKRNGLAQTEDIVPQSPDST